MVQRLSADWSAAYGHSLLLAESFVDPSKFCGYMYKAAGWTQLGRTKGYARANGRYTDPHGVLKDLHVFPLHRDTKSRMCAPDPLPDPLLPNPMGVNQHSTVTHYQRPNMTHPQEDGTGGEVSEILFFSAKSKRPPSLIYSMQIIPVCLSIVARRKGASATRRGGLNWTPISLLVGHPCKLFHKLGRSRSRAGPQDELSQSFLCRSSLVAFPSPPDEKEFLQPEGAANLDEISALRGSLLHDIPQAAALGSAYSAGRFQSATSSFSPCILAPP